ncbi:alpha/beta fold hydrolase [Celeribacter sp. ULVN23_4]
MTSTIQQPFKSGARFAYREAGRGEPVLLIHGVGMQSEAWMPQIEALSKTHHVIAVDMPGHGQSDPLPVGSMLQDFVAWLDKVIRTLGLEKVNLAGHSMGALISGGYAATHPNHVLRVALLNGVYCRSPEARAAVEGRADEIRAGKIDLETPLTRWFADTEADKTARAQAAKWLSAVDISGYATAYTAFSRGDRTYAALFDNISCPFLALTGDGDPNSTPDMARAMAAAAQDGEAVVLEGQRHMVNLTVPDVVNRQLQDWLKRPVKSKELQ